MSTKCNSGALEGAFNLIGIPLFLADWTTGAAAVAGEHRGCCATGHRLHGGRPPRTENAYPASSTAATGSSAPSRLAGGKGGGTSTQWRRTKVDFTRSDCHR